MLQKFFHKSNQKGIGGSGENAAARFLRRKGYKIIERNWYNKTGKRLGEIDLIVREKSGTIIFVEVKARSVDAEGDATMPEEQITRAKLQKLNRIAEAYIKEKELWDASWRMDAVTVIFIKNQKKPLIKHFESIFL